MIAHGYQQSLRICLAVILVAACRPRHGSPVERATPPRIVSAGLLSTAGPGSLPEWMLGVWMREWIRRGTDQSSSALVRYVQTERDFGDVRIPARPSFAQAASFADLSEADLRLLARQRGFVGTTSATGLVATWHHELDFQPADTSTDIGRVERVGMGGMYEHALDGTYMEHWRTLSDGDGRFVSVRVTRGTRLERVLLVAGDYFYFARNRTRDLPAGMSLDSLIASMRPSRAQLVEWLDCELSVGRVRGGRVPWEIEHSTLPWREGHRLEFAQRVVADSVTGTLSARAEAGELWRFSLAGLPPRDGVVLFPASP